MFRQNVGWMGWRQASFGLVAALSVYLASGNSVSAAPYTDNLDALIAELLARSAALSGSVDKVEIKQKKTVDKVLASFVKPSLSIITDIKLTGKAAKSLYKAYPTEFELTLTGIPITSTNLSLLIQGALAEFADDLTTLVEQAQLAVNLAPEGSCREKAQAALDDATLQLESLGAAPDTATFVKIVSTAAKNALKGQTLAEAIAECSSGGGGGGGGGAWYDWTMEVTVNGLKTSAYRNGQAGTGDDLYVTYYSNGGLAVNMAKVGGSPSCYIETNVGSPATLTPHPIFNGGTYSDGTNSYTITSGSLTITKWPSTFPGTGKADFSFSASGTAGAITGTGKFSVWIYAPF